MHSMKNASETGCAVRILSGYASGQRVSLLVTVKYILSQFSSGKDPNKSKYVYENLPVEKSNFPISIYV